MKNPGLDALRSVAVSCIACDTGECGPLVRVLEDGSHLHGDTDTGYCTHEEEALDG